mgnify:CR=1 FL=1
MKSIMKLRLWQIFACIMLVVGFVPPLHADDTEIFFARAQADNDQNQAIANVLFMLDTSGSMRWCKDRENGNGGFDAGWCSDAKNRRINILQQSLRDMLADVPEGVRIGLGRFNYLIPDVTVNANGQGQRGARIMLPVSDVTPGNLPTYLETIDTLNDAGDNADAGPNFPGAQPAGDTPTARAFSEMTRYMMGQAPKYGRGVDGQQTSVCLEEQEEKFNCVDVATGTSDWQQIEGTCNQLDPNCKSELGAWEPSTGCDTALDTCRAQFGEWQFSGATPCDLSKPTCGIAVGNWRNIAGTCDTSQPDCRLGGWNDWQVTISSGANGANCPTNQNTDVLQRRRVRVTSCSSIWFGLCFGRSTTNQCQERTRRFQQRDVDYYTRTLEFEEREQVFFTRETLFTEQCDIQTTCVDEAPIIADNKYVSPINPLNQCETNHVVLFTDGQPSGNDKPGNEGFVDCQGGASYDCQEDISAYLFKETNAKQRSVKTYNIGLFMGDAEASMQKVSTDGAEGTFNADDSAGLLQAFSQVIDLIADNARTVSSPGVAVNQMNRLEHLDQLYYAVFEPKRSSFWDGNVKRYRLGNGTIRGVNGPAVDPSNGFFREDARSFWSTEDDGADVTKGGAREHVGQRQLFYTDDQGNMRSFDFAANYSPEFFGLPADAEPEEVDAVVDGLGSIWGDPLHSEPVLVNYGNDSENNVIFASANDGMLHAVRSSSGEEVFSFMPYEFIRQAAEFTVDPPSLLQDNRRQLYGLDSSWTAWRRAGDSNSAPPSQVLLYGGMRRGGTSYFALDVTNLSSPKVLWRIDRGEPGFERLGQTWSQPTLLSVMVDGDRRAALVFGGGYSPDDHDLRQGEDRRNGGQDAMGNMLYVVDALSGELLWSVGRTGAMTGVNSMRHAVPASISVVDIDFDGVADHLYFGDLGGQIYRVDMDDEDVDDSDVHRLARLSGGSAADNRRFFFPPAVSFIKEGSEELLYVALGSGYRAHPLDDTVDDYFFVIRDDTALAGQSPTDLRFNDLFTLALDGSNQPPDGADGWKLELEDEGEKALASPVIFGNRLFFTSFRNGRDQLETNDCVFRIGTSFLYQVDVVTGRPSSITNDGTVSRREILAQDVPAPTPTLLSDGERISLIVGTEVVGGDDVGSTNLRRGSWFQLEPGEPDVVPMPAPGPPVTPPPMQP